MRVVKFRIWLANKLVRLAHIIRPKVVNDLLKELDYQFKYGDGTGRKVL